MGTTRSLWLVKLACLFQLTKDFVFVVKKSEKRSHFQECFGSPGISDISLSSLSFVSVEGLQHYLVM